MAKRRTKAAEPVRDDNLLATEPSAEPRTRKESRKRNPAPEPAAASAPAQDLDYIPEPLRPFATLISTLKLDPENVKDHGETDLPTHQASLREFGIRRMVVVRRENRQVEAGNGTCMAAQRNGWLYVPVLFVDDDVDRAKAFALADNAISTLAEWDEDRLKDLMSDTDGLLAGWTGEVDLNGLLSSVMSNLAVEIPDEEPGDTPVDPAADPETILISHRITVICRDEAHQKELMAELEAKGLECLLANRRVK